MNAVERHYRLITLRERILQIAGEVLACSDDVSDDTELERIAQAELCLNNAVAHLLAVSNLESLELLLELSIQRTRKRPAEVFLFPLNNSAG
jgi:hypothetical protein